MPSHVRLHLEEIFLCHIHLFLGFSLIAFDNLVRACARAFQPIHTEKSDVDCLSTTNGHLTGGGQMPPLRDAERNESPRPNKIVVYRVVCRHWSSPLTLVAELDVHLYRQ